MTSILILRQTKTRSVFFVIIRNLLYETKRNMKMNFKNHMLKLEVFPWLTVRGESHIDFRTQCVIMTQLI